MGQLSEKELSLLGDLLTDEQLLTKKFKMLAAQTQDTEIKQKFERISEQHQFLPEKNQPVRFLNNEIQTHN